MDRSVSSDRQEGTSTPARTSRKDIHIRKLQDLHFPIENCQTFVLGICGGDCAGKREMTQYMFDRQGEEWFIKDSQEPVTILRQNYFVNVSDGKKFSSEGTDWASFYKHVRSLMIGNEVDITFTKGGQESTVHLKPAKLLVIEGSHIYMSPEVTHHISSLINVKVFIDSDSDVRLSRRVFQDTQENKKDLNESVANYLEFIKPSYEREIEPTKQTSDIIIPHFGGGFNDHKKEYKQEFDSNIKNACGLILTHLKEEMKKYEECIEEEAK